MERKNYLSVSAAAAIRIEGRYIIRVLTEVVEHTVCQTYDVHDRQNTVNSIMLLC